MAYLLDLFTLETGATLCEVGAAKRSVIIAPLQNQGATDPEG